MATSIGGDKLSLNDERMRCLGLCVHTHVLKGVMWLGAWGFNQWHWSEVVTRCYTVPFQQAVAHSSHKTISVPRH